VILHDSVLREIARSRPKGKDALARISGIGESKLARFGEGIVKIVSAA
jgi:ATP-dependent DNA helicase RecQ